MTRPDHALEAVDLVAHAAWMRRIARDLVRDRDAADDLVQDAWVAALRRRRSEALASTRAWLGAVVQNLARNRARADLHRREREARAANMEAVDSELGNETEDRMEAAAMLMAALRRVAEPYRSTLVARYLDERSAADIARSSGAPAATIRWRIQHGLELLRTEFTRDRARGSSRRDEHALLALLAGAPESAFVSSAAGLAAGVLAMHGLLKIAAAAAAIAVAGVGWWALSGEFDARSQARVEDPAGAPTAGQKLELEGGAKADETVRAHAIEGGDEAHAASSSSSSVAIEPSASSIARIKARLVSEGGRPIPGGRIELAELPGTPAATSGMDGRVELEFDTDSLEDSAEGRSTIVTVSATGHATRFERARVARGKTVSLGELVLAPGVTLAGIVRFEDGRPAAGAEVVATGAEPFAGLQRARRTGPSTWPGAPRTRTDTAGRFELAGVASGERRVWAMSAGMRAVPSDVLVLEPSARRDDLVLVLEPLGENERIGGVVMTPEGEPVPKARIATTMRTGGGMTRNSITCDEKGRFELRLDELVPHEFTATDPEDRYSAVTRIDVPPGMLDLELRFEQPRHLRLEVVAESGKAVPEFTAKLLAAEGDDELDTRSSDPGLGGRLRLRAPSQPFRLSVDARGFALSEVGPLTPRVDDELVKVVLRPVPGIRGRVVRGGSGVSNARVELFEDPGPKRHVLVGGFQSRVLPEAVTDDVTDAEGQFDLTLRADGEYVLFARPSSGELAELGPLDLRAARGASDLVIEVLEPGSIEGQVLVAPGRDPEGWIVSINRGDLAPRSQRVGTDGRYRFDGVTPGEWLVLRTSHEAGRASGWGIGTGTEATRFRGNCTVRAGEVARFDLDLTDERPCALLGRLVVDGTPARSWSARLHAASGVSSGGAFPSGALDAEGRFRLEIDEPGAYRVHLAAPASERSMGLQFDVTLARGEQTFERELRTGRAEGRFADTKFHTNVYALLSGAKGLSGYAPIQCDEDGSFTLERVPIGQLTFHWTSATGEREELGTIQVEPGTTANFTRP